MSFNLYGEGWGLDLDQLKEIFAGATYLKESIGFTDEDVDRLFACFDSDGNQLVDSLEILIVLSLSSGRRCTSTIYAL
jgi:Ca2+-binding EF-hand superfamily protein